MSSSSPSSSSSTLSDSGFEDELLCSPVRCGGHRCASYGQVCDYEDSETFIIQRLNQQQFLALNCLSRQPQITAEARSKLVSWLIAVRRQLSLSFESCCLAVNIMDRFLITTSVAADCFQLLGVTSLLIATKQVEVYSPRITQLLSLCCNSFSREQLCNLECLILLRLNFRLAAPTLAFFLDYFTSHFAGHQTGEFISAQNAHPHKEPSSAENKWRWLACKVCELSLADYTFNKYAPSVIAQCALILAKDLLKTQSVQNTENNTGASKMICFEEDAPHTCENPLLFQQCMEDLKLLLSLNQEAVQDVP
ncbi:cyclin-O [Danio aesculapii]|uniref:cyclin-O n=1 Tax=Danio aesculapii TaxID=1142201 RepID=UPI0024C00916|nr:cyclin-O [Danio aesculapii]